MKKITTISLFIFWAVLVSIFVSGLIYYQNNKNQGIKITTPGSINEALVEKASSSAAVALRNSATQLSLAEIARHNSTKDCWLLINNKVYNVTSFIAAHPGGSGTIIPNCGKDSTQAYNTKGGKSSHSANANAMLVDYFIGNFDQQIGQQQIQTSVQNTNAVTPTVNAGDDDDEEDDD